MCFLFLFYVYFSLLYFCLFECKFEVWRKKTHLILFQVRFFFIIIKKKIKKKQIRSLRFFCRFLFFIFYFVFSFVLREGEKNPKKQIQKKKKR
jgi:hypothetical protein